MTFDQQPRFVTTSPIPQTPSTLTETQSSAPVNMKATFFIASFLAAVANAGTEATYCDSENLQGSCTDVDTHDDRLCGKHTHVYDGSRLLR